MITTIRTALFTTLLVTLCGFTEYGNQFLTAMTGTTVHLESEVHHLKNAADVYVKAIAPPPKTHGYSIYDGILTFTAMFAVIVILRELLNRVMYRFYRHREDSKTHTKWITWNLVSFLFTSIVGTYGFMMTKNVLLMFWKELWEILSTCGIAGFFSRCSVRIVDDYIPLQNMTPLTNQMIHNMDYSSHSSDVMFISILLVAYFTYDLIFNRPSREYIFHHLLSMLCVGIYAWTDSYAFYVAVAMVTELSTIFLAASVLFDKKSIMRAVTMVEFAATFFVCRIVLITTVVLIVWFNETGVRFWTPFIAFGILGVLNYYWFHLIVRKVIRVCKSVMAN
jgi:TLC domain